jgi:hypothetical protein
MLGLANGNQELSLEAVSDMKNATTILKVSPGCGANVHAYSLDSVSEGLVPMKYSKWRIY